MKQKYTGGGILEELSSLNIAADVAFSQKFIQQLQNSR